MKQDDKIDFGLKISDLNTIISVIKENNKITKIILFGSRAKGNFKNGSDIDLAIISENLSFDELLEIKVNLEELLLPYIFDLVDYNTITNEDLKQHIQRIGKIIFQK
ncbi:MAG TPA: nucleotidyltransferase domain-containing protein [Candidatus Kapabacteria bacterium]|nr:nucleotidyltransferase domain-containing protein [Candidatus Kapabacteria bacterium]